MVHPMAVEIGKTVALPFRAVNVLLAPFVKWVNQGEAKLNEIIRLVSEEVKNVPEGKLTPPEQYVAIPAMQAITYSMDSDELKRMYAKLLANAINADEKKSVHPAFVEIIKQMSPLDAKVLKAFSDQLHGSIPMCNIRRQKPSMKISSELPSFRKMTLGQDICSHFAAVSIPGANGLEIISSSENLRRLGLIEISESYHFTDEQYLYFENNAFIKGILMGIQDDPNAQNYEVVLIRISGKMTRLGDQFYQVCLSEPADKTV